MGRILDAIRALKGELATAEKRNERLVQFQRDVVDTLGDAAPQSDDATDATILAGVQSLRAQVDESAKTIHMLTGDRASAGRILDEALARIAAYELATARYAVELGEATDQEIALVESADAADAPKAIGVSVIDGSDVYPGEVPDGAEAAEVAEVVEAEANADTA